MTHNNCRTLQNICLNFNLNLTNFIHRINWHIPCTFTYYSIFSRNQITLLSL